MKTKKVLRIVSTALGLVMATGLACGTLAACGGGEKPLVLSMETPDGVFNPFFYTSGADGEIVGQTMVGMISTDKNGDIVAGEDEPCVALDYSVVKHGSRDTWNGQDYNDYYTDYYFAVKDNILFSDGTQLTIKDVLFNLYMYLDPAYTGSSTMYSVNIQGLKAYRTQTPNADEQQGSGGGLDALLDEFANTRISALLNWAKEDSSKLDELSQESKEDLDKIAGFFKEEIATDWNTAQNADLKEYEKYVDEDGNKLITDYWQVFLYNYGVLQLIAHRNTDPSTGKVTKKWYEAQRNYDNNIAKTEEALTEYVYTFMLGQSDRSGTAYKQHLTEVITMYATANTFRQYLRGIAIKEFVGDELAVRSVSGIDTYRASTIPAEDGTEKQLGKELDILHIRVNGEDPKAIQNFGFTVAPMDYYTAPWKKNHTTKEFSTEEGKEYFGVEFGDPDFMDSIRYIQVPMGAGPYRASTENGTEPGDIGSVSKTSFFSDNIVYLESNENFFLGAPKIKLLRFKVISTSLLYEAVKNGEVNYASPSGTQEIMTNLDGVDRNVLDYTLTDNLGYGYIGVNASYVHDIEIRKAIMYAMDTQLCIDYYGSGTLASAIYRPMSKTIGWCYPENSTAYYPYEENLEPDPDNPNKMIATGKKSLELAREAGYDNVDSDGYLINDAGERLKFTFTIAGDSTDHPAYACMNNAAELLNKIGFDITVTRDSTALSKLAAGRLEVWAAAWSSSSDPDMYQVYHKDSSATSILAWGFPWIESSSENQEEKNLLDELALRIEEGRETSDREERKEIYAGEPKGSTSDIGNLSALDLVMELAVELPTYQRKALYVYQRDLFDDESIKLFAESTAFQSPLNRIWEVGFREA